MFADNQKKNKENNTFCVGEKQLTWCILLAIGMLCIVMLLSYTLGYRSAIRNTVIEKAQRDSFADQIYTSIANETLMINGCDEGFYLRCSIKNPQDLAAIMLIGKEYGITFGFEEEQSSSQNSENSQCTIISSVVNTRKEADAIAKIIQDTFNLNTYDIISAKKPLTNTETERPFS